MVGKHLAEILIIIMFIFSTLFTGISMIITGKYVGELSYFDLGVDNLEVVFVLLLTVIGYFIVYLIYRIRKNKKKYLLGKKWTVNVRKFNSVFFILVVSQIIFLLITDVGRVGSSAQSGMSFILAILNVDSIFGLYYFLCRDLEKKKYFLNIALYIALKLIQGWTGMLLSIALFELYFYYKKRKKINLLNLVKLIFISIGAISIGAKIYQYAYAFKFYIRSNTMINLSYFEGFSNLVNRLSFFPMSIGAHQNEDLIKQLYLVNYAKFAELQSFFRPMLPRFIMPDKEFGVLNNIVIQSFFNDVTYTTSSNFGFIMYTKTLFQINLIEGFLWLICTIFMCSIIRKLYNSLEQYNGQLDFLYFILLLNIYSVASLEQVFGYGYSRLIYIIPILISLKVITNQKRGIL